MIKTKIVKIKGDWEEVVNDCRFTVNKSDLGKEPSDSFKKSILMAEHSPIRDLIFKWEWEDIPHWVTVHWVRHKWEKFVATQRSDRTGIDRNSLPQSTPQNMRGEANVQALIDTMRKRLCYQASKETREYAESLKSAITEVDQHIGDVLVPNCIYRCGCCEYSSEDPNRCRFFEAFSANLSREDLLSLNTRYSKYNDMFKKKVQHEADKEAY